MRRTTNWCTVPSVTKEPQRDLSGLVQLRRQLLSDGLTDNQIARLLRANVLVRIRHGAYVRSEIWAELTDADRHRLRSRAVLAVAHPSTVLTHVSSVLERGGDVWGLPEDVVHTSQADRTRAGRRRSDWIPHRGQLREEDIETINGVRVSVATRSAVEVCSIAKVEPALVVVNGLLRLKAMTLEDFHAAVQSSQRWPGSLTTDVVLRLADPRLESPGEDRFSYFCYREGLPKPEPQVEIFDEDGTSFARVDFAWPEFRVFVEFDGRAKYERFRREGETLEEFLMREKDREEKICQLTGWVCIRVTWADLNRPRQLAARIQKMLAGHGSAAS